MAARLGRFVAGLAAAMRHALAEATHKGFPVGDDTRRGFALIERWLAGERVSSEAMLDALRAARADGDRLHKIYMQQKDQSGGFNQAGWAATAVGNLCWLTSKPRGWASSSAGVMDAAAYTLGRDHLKIGATLAELGALRQAAEAAAPPAVAALRPPQPAQPGASKGRPRAVGAGIAEHVGTWVAARLAKHRAKLDPNRRAEPDQLHTRLAQRGYPAHPSVLAFEARYGGLLAPGDASDSSGLFIFGAWTCLAEDGFVPRGGPGNQDQALVPVGCGPSDDIYFLDAAGAGWAQFTIEDVDAMPFAHDMDCLIARTVLYHTLFQRRMKRQVVDLAGARGAEIARALALPLIKPASDARARMWADARTLLIEHGERGQVTQTSLASPAKATRERFLRA